MVWGHQYMVYMVYGAGATGRRVRVMVTTSYIPASSHPQPVPVRPSKDAGKVFADMKNDCPSRGGFQKYARVQLSEISSKQFGLVWIGLDWIGWESLVMVELGR